MRSLFSFARVHVYLIELDKRVTSARADRGFGFGVKFIFILTHTPELKFFNVMRASFDMLSIAMDASERVVTVTKEGVMDFIQRHQVALVYFWHPKCDGCVALHPILEKMAEEYTGRCTFGMTNIDLDGEIDPEFREKFWISAVPTVAITWKGQLVAHFQMTESLIPSVIRQVLNHHFDTVNTE